MVSGFRISAFSFCLLALFVGQLDAAEETVETLFDLSFEDLLNVKISTGSLTDFSAKYSPAAITMIQKEQIDLSASRNLATLLEEYVPGMMLMTHSEGDKIGIRGMIAAENYKLLLLVNGVNITNNIYEGAMMELDQWQLGDIERIEVIRGPGSVTYGSGAIAGVINIITKKANRDAPKSAWSVSYLPEYESKGFSFESTKYWGDWGAFFYGSVRETEGLQNPNYYSMSPNEPTDIRYIGKRSLDEKGPQPYLQDSLGRPQVKLHLDLNNGDDFRVWARYTQSGQSHHFRTYVPYRDEAGDFLEDTTWRKVSIRNVVVNPEYTTELSDSLGMKLRLSFDDQEYIRYDFQNVDWPETHPNNIRDYAFSQERVVASALFDYDDGGRLRVATGFEFNRTAAKAPWGEGDDHILIREGVSLISDKDTSVYLGYPEARSRPDPNRLEEVGSGMDFETFTQLSEVSYDLNSKVDLVYAHRLDFPKVADTMYAPRLSLIADLPDESTLRLSAQRSLRMMPLRAQYLFDKYERENSVSGTDYESLDSIELAYTKMVNDNVLLDFNAFYNDSDTVGFTGQDLQFLGKLKLVGLELQAKFQWGNTELALNHSYLDLLDMTMNPDLKTGGNRNNISFSDYFHYTSGEVPILLEGYGNSLNNWSTHSSRLLLTSRFLDDRLSLHLSARVNWDYEGAYDEMNMFQRAYDTFDTMGLDSQALAAFEAQRAKFQRERSLLDAEDAYRTDLRVNGSVSYRFETGDQSEIVASLFVENLFGSQKRYYVSTGSSQYFPNRISFLEEPTSVGVRVCVKYR